MKKLLLIVLLCISVNAQVRDKGEIYAIVNYWIKDHNVTREIVQPKQTATSLFLSKDENGSEANNTKTAIEMLTPTLNTPKQSGILDLGDNVESNITKNYEIIKLKPTGWVIVSKVKIAHPILGYSFDSNATPAFDTPEEFQAWLDSVNRTLAEAKTEIGDSQNLLARGGNVNRLQHKGPLLGRINWAQNYPYNKYIPHRYLVGCVATAFSQIMAYYRWPKHGIGSHSYTRNGQRFSANFNTNYDFDNDKAKISYHVGVAFDMKYGSTISSTWPSPTRLQRFAHSFKYVVPPLEQKNNYSANSWDNKIKNSIDRGHPIYYQGQSNGKYGHAFLCDGYSYENGVKMYHFNWGWRGAYNGWFTIEPIQGYSLTRFPDEQRAIFNIRPNRAYSDTTTNPPQNTTPIPATQTKAKILSPYDGEAIFSKYLKLKIDKKSAKKVRVTIFSQTLNKYIYNRYTTSSSVRIKIPTIDDKLTIRIDSYNRNNQSLGHNTITVFRLPKNQVKTKKNSNKSTRAVLIYPKNKQVVTDGYIQVKWNPNSAYSVKLISYSYGLKSCLFHGFVSGNSKYIYIPKNSGKTFVGVYTIDKDGKNSYISYVFVKQRNGIGSTNVAKITSPKNKDIVSNKNITIKWQKNSAYKTKLQVYSYNKKRYIFKKSTRKSSIKIAKSNNDDTLFVQLISYDKRGNKIGDNSIFLFTQSQKIELNLIVNPKHNPYIAKLLKPNNNQIFHKRKIKITFKKQKAHKMQLRVYSYTRNKFIFNRFVKKSKVIKVSKKDKVLVAQLISYNKKGKPIGYTYRYFFIGK